MNLIFGMMACLTVSYDTTKNQTLMLVKTRHILNSRSFFPGVNNPKTNVFFRFGYEKLDSTLNFIYDTKELVFENDGNP